MIVMGMFSVFWLSFGVLQTPSWGIAAAYSATGDEAAGAASVGYNAAIALYLMVWGFWLFTTFIFTLKTNTVFALIFLCAFLSSFIIGGAYWKVSTGEYAMAMRLQKVSSRPLSPPSCDELAADSVSGRCRDFLRVSLAWILYYGGYDRGRDAHDTQVASGRPLSLLAEI